jgi:hypothetical protein
MIPRSIYLYYWFGTCLRYLQDAPSGTLLGKPDGDSIKFNLKRFFEYLDALDLQVTARAARELRALFDELSQLDPAGDLSADQAPRLSNLVSQVRLTLDAELEGVKAYVITPKRLDIHQLLKSIPTLFSPGIYNKLPPIAQYDFTEAGRCIAFERSTAATFHLLRGTEAVLKKFYCALTGRKTCKLMWAATVDELRTRRKAEPYNVLLDNLDNIRRSFRNPTQHPEMIYDIHEVQDLWGLCVDAVNRMAKALV